MNSLETLSVYAQLRGYPFCSEFVEQGGFKGEHGNLNSNACKKVMSLRVR